MSTDKIWIKVSESLPSPTLDHLGHRGWVLGRFGSDKAISVVRWLTDYNRWQNWDYSWCLRFPTEWMYIPEDLKLKPPMESRTVSQGKLCDICKERPGSCASIATPMLITRDQQNRGIMPTGDTIVYSCDECEGPKYFFDPETRQIVNPKGKGMCDK